MSGSRSVPAAATDFRATAIFRRFPSGVPAVFLSAVFSLFTAAFLLSACAPRPVVIRQKPPSPPPARVHKDVKIPPGHMPPPGECRVWYPDLPPGKQPPPGECRKLERSVPRGAVLVYGR
jgi:hypothetical protein